MKSVLVVCTQEQDRHELAESKIGNDCSVVFSDFDGSVFEKILAGLLPKLPPEYDPEVYMAYLNTLCDELGIDTVVSTCDYPGSLTAGFLSDQRRYSAASLQSVLRCQHKYYSRLAQQQYVPEATPRFVLVNRDNFDEIEAIGFPLFIKPVKSYFSVFARQVNNQDELRVYFEQVSIPEQFLLPFNWFANHHGLSAYQGHFIAEEMLCGKQVTLEGFVYNNEVEVIGIVDSHMVSGTISFSRFEYPSCLSLAVQQRMTDIAKRFMRGIGFNNNLFNIEFMYNPDTDAIYIIEVNSRMSVQFADLFEMVNGVNSYKILLSLALDTKPVVKTETDFSVAASFVLRMREDKRVVCVPSKQQIEIVKALYPEFRIYSWLSVGDCLSDMIQDGVSYMYCWMHLGARDTKELQEKFERCKLMLPFGFEAV